MARSTANRSFRTVPLDMGRGSWMSGDAARIPRGYCRKMRNMMLRDGVWTKRPQFTYDNLTAISSLGQWFDTANGTIRAVAMNTSGNLFIKNTTGETWSASVGTASGAAGFSDVATYRGRLLMAGVNSSRIPVGLFVSNGSSVDFKPLGAGSSGQSVNLKPKTLAIYKERAVYGGCTLEFLNYLYQQAGTDWAYDPSTWTLTNVTTAVITSGGTTLQRITPTNTTSSSLITQTPIGNAGFGAAQDIVYLGGLRNTHPTYRMPITLQLKYTNSWVTANPYVLGEIVTPTTPNNLRYRCSVAGTSAAGEPAWPLTVGGTVADGTATWTCDGSDVGAATEVTLPNATDSQDFVEIQVRMRVPAGANTGISPAIKFGTAAISTITLAAVDFSYKDGKTDGDPNKKNYGHQATIGSLAVPFGNRETKGNITYAPAPDDGFFWSPVAEPTEVTATGRFFLREVPGPVTLVRVVGGRLVVAKRRALWTFLATEDERLPFLPEGDAHVGVGVLDPQSADVFEDTLYFMDENEIYAWSVGKPGAKPVPLCGDAMREEIMNKASASWVESQTYNAPLLKIDHKNAELWVYAQKGKWHCYDIRGGAWSGHDAGGGSSATPVGYEGRALSYHPVTGNMYFGFGTAAAGTAGIARLDPSQSPAADSISTSGTLTVYAECIPRPIETSTPAADVMVHKLRFRHAVTASQTGQTTTGYVSFDGGITYPRYNEFTLASVSTGGFRPLEYAVYQSWGSILSRLVHAGNGGAASFNVSAVEADVQLLRGFFPKDMPTAGASSL